MANCKICIKNHKYDICKAIKNHSSISYSKVRKYDWCAYWESIYKCIIKKYFAIYSV